MIFTTSLNNNVYPDFTSFPVRNFSLVRSDPLCLVFFVQHHIPMWLCFFLPPTILIWKKPLSFFSWITTCSRQFSIHSFISFSQKSFEVEIIFSLQMRKLKLMRLNGLANIRFNSTSVLTLLSILLMTEKHTDMSILKSSQDVEGENKLSEMYVDWISSCLYMVLYSIIS